MAFCPFGSCLGFVVGVGRECAFDSTWAAPGSSFSGVEVVGVEEGCGDVVRTAVYCNAQEML